VTALLEAQTAKTRVPGTDRVEWIDGARGLSIVLMIVSHVGLVTGLTPAWFHLYAMRPVAPVFLLLLGMLWRPGFRPRHIQFAVGIVVAQLLALSLGFPAPNILAVMGLCLLAMPLAIRWPTAALSLCVTQLMFWPMPDWWTGYAPGFALALVLGGALLPRDGYVKAYGQLGVRLGLAAVGRRPLTWYLGHLLVLTVTVAVIVATSPA
jgi:hypothetical protein